MYQDQDAFPPPPRMICLEAENILSSGINPNVPILCDNVICVRLLRTCMTSYEFWLASGRFRGKSLGQRTKLLVAVMHGSEKGQLLREILQGDHTHADAYLPSILATAVQLFGRLMRSAISINTWCYACNSLIDLLATAFTIS